MFKRKSEILTSHNPQSFNELALAIFHFQATNVPIYREYLKLIKCQPHDIQRTQDIPYLPIEFFKSHEVFVNGLEKQHVFTSSGTTSSQTSSHFVVDLTWYEKTFTTGFELFYNSPKNLTIVALLPSYLERSGSSLVYMAEKLIAQSNSELSGFFLHDYARLQEILQTLKLNGQPTLLLGVSYALLDMAEKFPVDFPELLVMETGGMKGKRKEMVRSELHKVLQNGFNVSQIHSEYGMTELMSQAYSKGNGFFTCPPWMAINIREHNDPFSTARIGKTGGVNIIDLANVDSCSFIATSDLGRKYENGDFEILGRFDHSDARGCNLIMMEP